MLRKQPLRVMPFLSTQNIKHNASVFRINVGSRTIQYSVIGEIRNRIMADSAKKLNDHICKYAAYLFEDDLFSVVFNDWFTKLNKTHFRGKDSYAYTESEFIKEFQKLLADFVPSTASELMPPSPAQAVDVPDEQPVPTQSTGDKVIKLDFKGGKSASVSITEDLTEDEIKILCKYIKHMLT